MKKTIFLTTLTIAIFFIFAGKSLAANCLYGCYPNSCPTGTSGISGDCNAGFTCCRDTGTTPGSGATPNTLGSPTTGGGTFGNPLGETKTLEAVLGNIYKYLTLYVVGPLAVIFIVIGGIMYMLSSGDKERAERAKKTVIYAIVGLAIVVGSSYFYNEIKLIISGNGSTTSQLQTILLNVLKLLLSIVGFLAIISMVIGAIWMFTAVGDEERYELGKKTATYSIVGLVIALSALIIAQQVSSLIGNGSSVINNAANSPATGATPGAPAVPTVPNTTPSLPNVM